MKLTYDEYYPTLEEELSRHDNIADPLERYSLLIRDVGDAISAIGHPPAEDDHNLKDQIFHFKEVLAPLYGKLIFYYKCFQLEYEKCFSTEEQGKKYMEKELNMVRDFFRIYHLFCQYFFSGATWQDRELYTHRNHAVLQIDPSILQFTGNINPGCTLKACVIAFDQYSKLIKEKIDKAEADTTMPSLVFNGKDIDIVEIGRWFYVHKSFSNAGKPATQKQVMERVQKLCNREVANFEQLNISITNRKKDPFAFMTEVRKALEQHLDRIENKKPRL